MGTRSFLSYHSRQQRLKGRGNKHLRKVINYAFRLSDSHVLQHTPRNLSHFPLYPTDSRSLRQLWRGDLFLLCLWVFPKWNVKTPCGLFPFTTCLRPWIFDSPVPAAAELHYIQYPDQTTSITCRTTCWTCWMRGGLFWFSGGCEWTSNGCCHSAEWVLVVPKDWGEWISVCDPFLIGMRTTKPISRNDCCSRQVVTVNSPVILLCVECEWWSCGVKKTNLEEERE